MGKRIVIDDGNTHSPYIEKGFLFISNVNVFKLKDISAIICSDYARETTIVVGGVQFNYNLYCSCGACGVEKIIKIWTEAK